MRQIETDVEVYTWSSDKGVIVAYVHDLLKVSLDAFERNIPCARVKVMYVNVTSGKAKNAFVVFNVNDCHDGVRVFNPTTLVTNLWLACPYEML